MSQRPEFDCSPELKRLFMRELDSWRHATRLGLAELSQRCGVSPSYLAHIGRYGRIPSKPVLVLLALNFGMTSPKEIFTAARIDDDWPFEGALRLAPVENRNSSFLSVKLDMQGLLEAIKDTLRTEKQPSSLREVLNGRPLRIGLNLNQFWMFERAQAGALDHNRGMLPDLCRMLQAALQCEIETFPVPFDRYVERLHRGEIDLYGLLMASSQSPPHITFSLPVHRVGLSALYRKRDTVGLSPLPPPASIEDLTHRPYTIAVLKDARPHLFCTTRLRRPADLTIVCNSDEEALERVLLRGIARPAHLFLTNSMLASRLAHDHADALQPLFTGAGASLEMCNNAFALRPDWRDLGHLFNNSLTYALNAGGFHQKVQALIDGDARGKIELVPYSFETEENRALG